MISNQKKQIPVGLEYLKVKEMVGFKTLIKTIRIIPFFM